MYVPPPKKKQYKSNSGCETYRSMKVANAEMQLTSRDITDQICY